MRWRSHRTALARLARATRRVKDVIRKFEYESKSSPGTKYTCILKRDGTAECNCPGWTRHTYDQGEPHELAHHESRENWKAQVFRKCKHTKDALAALKLIEDTSKEVGFEVDI